MAKPIGAERLEGTANRGRSGDFAGVRHRPETLGLRERERLLVRFRRILGLEAPEADPDDSALAVVRRPANRGDRLVDREAARDVGGQPHLDPVLFARLLRARADAL